MATVAPESWMGFRLYANTRPSRPKEELLRDMDRRRENITNRRQALDEFRNHSKTVSRVPYVLCVLVALAMAAHAVATNNQESDPDDSSASTPEDRMRECGCSRNHTLNLAPTMKCEVSPNEVDDVEGNIIFFDGEHYKCSPSYISLLNSKKPPRQKPQSLEKQNQMLRRNIEVLKTVSKGRFEDTNIVGKTKPVVQLHNKASYKPAKSRPSRALPVRQDPVDEPTLDISNHIDPHEDATTPENAIEDPPVPDDSRGSTPEPHQESRDIIQDLANGRPGSRISRKPSRAALSPTNEELTAPVLSSTNEDAGEASYPSDSSDTDEEFKGSPPHIDSPGSQGSPFSHWEYAYNARKGNDLQNKLAELSDIFKALHAFSYDDSSHDVINDVIKGVARDLIDERRTGGKTPLAVIRDLIELAIQGRLSRDNNQRILRVAAEHLDRADTTQYFPGASCSPAEIHAKMKKYVQRKCKDQPKGVDPGSRPVSDTEAGYILCAANDLKFSREEDIPSGCVATDKPPEECKKAIDSSLSCDSSPRSRRKRSVERAGRDPICLILDFLASKGHPSHYECA